MPCVFWSRAHVTGTPRSSCGAATLAAALLVASVTVAPRGAAAQHARPAAVRVESHGTLDADSAAAEAARASVRAVARAHGLHRQRAVLVGGALVGTSMALAQGSTMQACLATQPWTVPDPDLSMYMWDGFCAPRWAHHLLRASVSLGVAGGAALVLPDTGMASPTLVAGAVTVATVIVPLLVGYATGAYRFQAGDFLADAWISAAPLVVVQYRRGWRRGALATAAYAAGYLLLAPYASP
ncbi:MAG TPA: hypothetical protein VEZ47_06750 [Gemmatirosa sp.]|nr:hypothetical protein [Gemmatirosa sp.]